MTEQERQAVLDQEHLKLLEIGYWVAGGFGAVIALFPLIYVAFGGMMVLGEFGRGKEAAPAVVGAVLIVIGCVVSAVLAALAALKLATARALRTRRHRMLCMATGALSCLGIPWGTALGVCTFLVLERPSVAALFGGPPALAGAGQAPTTPGAPGSGGIA